MTINVKIRKEGGAPLLLMWWKGWPQIRRSQSAEIVTARFLG